MKKVITYGVFDYTHLGHVRLLKNIHSMIDDEIHLTVAIHADEYVIKNKPGITLLYSQDNRMEMIGAIRGVDSVVLYDQIDTDLPNRDFDILAVGPDQNNPHFITAIEYCRKNGKQVLIIPRTQNICSSLIRQRIINGDKNE